MTRLAEIGQELKAAREGRRRSLADIATETHLKLNHLQALEDGDESRLPEPVYVKSFIRKYAQAVGLPADELANRYWETRPLPPPPPQAREINVPWWAYTLLFGLVLFGLIAVAWYYSSQPPRPAASPAATAAPTPAATPASPSVPVQAPMATGMATGSMVATGAVPTVIATPSAAPALQATPTPRPTLAPRPTPRPTVRPTPRPTVAPAATGSASTPATTSLEATGNNPDPNAVLTLRATGVSWVRIMRGGRTIYEETMGPGQTEQWPIRDGLTVTIGNGAAIEVTAGDEKLGALGGQNQVVRRVFR